MTKGDDYISRQAAIEAVNGLTYPSSLVDVKRRLVGLPTADVRKNVHGKWYTETYKFAPERYVCTVCVCGSREKWNFCPNCGADMRAGKERIVLA